MQEAEALPAGGGQHLQERFLQALALGQLSLAWPAAVHLNQLDAWRDLGDAALQALELDLAIRSAPYSFIGWRQPLTPDPIQRLHVLLTTQSRQFILEQPSLLR